MTIEKIWESLDENFKEEPSWWATNIPTEAEIIEAENKLNLKFHNGYKNYLRKYGGGGPFCYNLYGLKYAGGMDKDNYTVVTNTNFYQQRQWPDIDRLYIISQDLSGNPIGIDPQGIVWLSDHDAGFEKVKLADNFEEFLYKLHTDTLYD
ncbi:MAG: SMI1/KNR4 family protein [Candidatus Paracaedibacteraceae bacterium]|nr:SMI1/KNR4 family protein [Candidatus Paracaedibacteraceae bacterium]